MTRSQNPPPSRRERRAAARLEPRGPRARARRPQDRPVWQSPLAIITVVAVLVGVVVILFGLPRDEPPGELVIPAMPYTADLTDGEAVGPADAPVVMEIYSDFQCPACKVFVTNQLAGFVNEFAKPGTLRIEARDIVIIDRGGSEESLRLAVGAACAAEQDRYWQFHDIVFANQGRENRGDHDAAFIARVADAAGVDRAAWDACIAREDVAAAIRSQTSTALSSGIGSTPTLVLNGQRLQSGVQPYADVAAMIQALASPAPAASPSPNP
ncbi:MAG TPA: thioredoxin domain-containing protein [Candidatus Deferrimicrobiaceae bacterium]|nr:thioredoxin domain-containing protein [Candidatus Deferrimicrobiaceae bacterium]